MEYVIVTVKRKDEAAVYDMRFPINMEIALLAEAVAQELNWRDKNKRLISYDIEAFPVGSEEGKLLKLDETLADAGIWDGSWLVFHPLEIEVPTSAPSEPEAPETNSDSPVKQWRKV